MGLRRDRPSEQRGGPPGFRLLDGGTIAISAGEAREPGGDVCCFCGESLARSDPRHVTLSVRWSNELGRGESWVAHDSCLAERLDERVKGSGASPDRG